MILKNYLSSLFFVAIALVCGIEFNKFFGSVLVVAPVFARENPLFQDAIQLYELGYEQFESGQLQEALGTFERALVKVRKSGDRELEAVILNDIGITYRHLGNYPQALHFLEQALTLRKMIDDRAGIGQSLVNLAAVYQSQGNYPQALDFYEQALVILKEQNEQYGQAVVFNNMGELHRSLGQPHKALVSFENALDLFEQEGDRVAMGIALANIGTAYDALGNYRQALATYQQAMAIATTENDAVGIGQIQLNLGAVYEKLSDYNQALSSYEQGLAIMTEIGDRSAMSQALNNLGSVHRFLGNYSQAIAFYDRALAIRQAIGDRAGIAVTLNHKGAALFESGNIEKATLTLYAALDALEALRPGLNDRDKISIFDRYRSSYGILQKALIAQDRIETALEVAERGRARAFVELIAKQLDPETVQNYAAQTINSLTFSEIQQIAAAQKATLVEYSIVTDSFGKNSKLLIWVIQPTGKIHFRQVDLSQLEQFQNNLVPLLSRQETEPILTALVRGTRSDLATEMPSIAVTDVTEKRLKALHKLLIAPIAEFLPQNPDDRLIFIPHQELLFVPFPALQDERDRYLIEQHTLLTAPSIQVLQLTRQIQQQRPPFVDNALVVGNPIFTEIRGRNLQGLKDLPNAELEAIAIASLLKTQPLIGSEATETTVVERMTSANIIHLATHGLLEDFTDAGIPGAIAFAASDRDDGLLTAAEILNLKLNASLVVLSACNTGGGSITGDGIIGLSRTLIGAGSESVIVSLWQVDDRATAQLMPEFYQILAQRGDRAVALRQAMLATMQQYPDPKDWAAFTLIGEATQAQNR